MGSVGIIGIVLIIINVIVSYKGFKDELFFNAYKFEVEKITIYKDYKRLITSGFLHVSWIHLIFNMIALFMFSGAIEGSLGELRFVIIYFVSLIGGNLFSLYIHRNAGDYSVVGASGAIFGIIFAAIAVFPGMHIGLFIIPLSIPGWLFGLLFVLFSIYGIRSKSENVGNEAHLGGAVAGMMVALLMIPEAISQNYITILIILVPVVIFIYLIITKPQILLIDNLFFKQHNNFYDIDQQYNADKYNQQKQVDDILEKINKKGMKSLSKKEKAILDNYSRSLKER